MHRITFILPMLLLPLFSAAQNAFEYSISKPYEVIDARQKYYFSALNEEKSISVKIDGREIHLQLFDAKTMKEIKRNKITDMPKGFAIENITWFEGHLYCFFSLWDGDKDNEQLFVREIDFENCKFAGKEKRIIAVKGKLSGAPAAFVGIWSVGTVDKFSFLFSRDKSKMLVQYRRTPEIKRDHLSHDLIGMYVFDKDLVVLAGNEIKMPYTEKKMDNVDYSVDSEGTPYVLAKVYDDDSTRDSKGKGDKKEANYHMELFRVNIADKSIKTTKIGVDKYFIKDIWIYEDAGNAMLCSGFYNNMSNGWTWSSSISDGNADGLFLFRLDKEGGIADKKFYEIPLDVINQYNKAGAQKDNAKKDKKGKAELANLELRELIIQDDNSLIIVGEQYFVEYTYTTRGNVTYTYHYNDMLLTKIGADGQLAWMRKLPKNQTGGQGRGGMSFKRMTIGGNHYLVFLDNVKNLKLGLNERPARHVDGMGGYLTAYGVDDATGKVRKISILDTKKAKGGHELFQFRTDRVFQISDTEFLTEFYKKGKEDVMVKVKMK